MKVYKIFLNYFEAEPNGFASLAFLYRIMLI